MSEYQLPTIERIREELPELTKEIRKRASILGAVTIAGQLNNWVYSDELADLFDAWLAEVKAQERKAERERIIGLLMANELDRTILTAIVDLIEGEEQNV